jgi:hypothetical protein
MLHGWLLLDRGSAREAIATLVFLVPVVLGGSLVVAAVATLVLQSQFKWALLRRIGRWPGVQSMEAAAVSTAWGPGGGGTAMTVHAGGVA